MPVEANLTADTRWTFDAEVADAFDDMLARSIPDYETMRALVTDLAIRHLRPGTSVLDLGTSRGEALDLIRRRVNVDLPAWGRLGTRLVGLELSEPMHAAAAARFAEEPLADIVLHDLRQGLPQACRDREFGSVLSVLTLMFTPPEHRAQLAAEVYDVLVPGGAFLLVEKVTAPNGKIEATLRTHYHDHKRAMGYTDEEIVRKAASLEGVLMPATARANEELLAGAGFRHVECVWRYACFAGWLAVK